MGKQVGKIVSQYIVLYYVRGKLCMEHFPDVYSASLWAKKRGGYILKEVEMAEVDENKNG